MTQTASKKQGDLFFEELPPNFDFTGFLSDLFGLEPVSAYPVGSWSGFCPAILQVLAGGDRSKLLEIYNLRENDSGKVTGQKRFLFFVFSLCRNTGAFSELDQIIREYEAEKFCSFPAEICRKCGRKISGFTENIPLCAGRNFECFVPETAKTVSVDPMLDESDEFAKEIAAQLGQNFEAGEVKGFHFDFMLGGVPAFIWRFRDFEMEEHVFLDILKRAGKAGIQMLYIVAYANLVSRIPVSIVGCIPYVLLPLAAEDKEVAVFDYSSAESSFGKLN